MATQIVIEASDGATIGLSRRYVPNEMWMALNTRDDLSLTISLCPQSVRALKKICEFFEQELER